MRVLHFLPVYSPAWQYGGPILSVSRLCEALVQIGADVRVITTNAGLPGFSQDQLSTPQIVNGVQVFYYPVDSHSGTIRSAAFVEALSEHISWADILHISTIWQPLGVAVQSTAHSLDVPVIQTLRGALGPYSLMQKPWKKLPYYLLREYPFLRKVQAIHCTTLQEAREISWLALPPPVEIIPNPLDLSSFSCSSEVASSWRSSFDIQPDDTVFVIAGRLHHKKGLDLLPSAFGAIKNHRWQLFIVGDDEDGTGKTLKRSFESLGLQHRVRFINSMPSSDLMGPLNAADWLLLPSRHENFGNIVIEALACGCGALLSDRVGVGEFLLDCPGVHSRKRNLNEWISLLQQCLVETRPGTHSSVFVKRLFNQHIIASQAVSLYERILSHD